jgi:hypothetical protein
LVGVQMTLRFLRARDGFSLTGFPYVAGPGSPHPSNGIGIRLRDFGTLRSSGPVVMIRVGASPSRSIGFLAAVTLRSLQLQPLEQGWSAAMARMFARMGGVCEKIRPLSHVGKRIFDAQI